MSRGIKSGNRYLPLEDMEITSVQEGYSVTDNNIEVSFQEGEEEQRGFLQKALQDGDTIEMFRTLGGSREVARCLVNRGFSNGFEISISGGWLLYGDFH